MSERYKVRDNYSCVYTKKQTCTVLYNLHEEFHDYIHLSLIYKDLLPAYCAKCPTLKVLADKLVSEGKEWIESSTERE